MKAAGDQFDLETSFAKLFIFMCGYIISVSIALIEARWDNMRF